MKWFVMDLKVLYLGEMNMDIKIPVSKEPTPYAVTCQKDGFVYMTHEFYITQLSDPHSKWICPICFEISEWNDQNYDEHMEREMAKCVARDFY
jgi:hypothetical protein